MTRSQRVAALWFIAGVAMLLAGFLVTPPYLLAIVAAVLFFILGILAIRRG